MNPYFFGFTPLPRNQLARAEAVNAIFDSIVVGFDKLPDDDLLKQDRLTYANDSGAVNAYAVAVDASITGLVAGLRLTMKVGTKNTGPSTINVNAIGPVAIKRFDGSDVSPGDVQGVVVLVFDGVYFHLVSQHASEAIATATSAAAALASANAAAASAATATTGAATATTQAGISTTAAGTATTQADIATAGAGTATTQATSASTSATTATTQAGIATTGATTATTQAGLAAAGATTATTQADIATAGAGTATTQAGIATTGGTTATTQAGIATGAATTATTQAGIATTQAGTATTQATNAATSAGTATTQAGIATTGAGTATTQAGIATGAATTATAAAGSASTDAGTATTQAGVAVAAAAQALVSAGAVGSYVSQWTIAGGTANALTGAFPTPITTLIDGLIVGFQNVNSNNTVKNPTFKADNTAATQIVREGYRTLNNGDMANGGEYFIRYTTASGPYWILLNPNSAENSAAVTVASATATNLNSTNIDGLVRINLSGTTTITSFTGGPCTRKITVTGAPLITASANIMTPTGGNIQAATNDTFEILIDAGGVSHISNYQPYGGVIESLAVGAQCGNAVYAQLASIPLLVGKWRLTGVFASGAISTCTYLGLNILPVSAVSTGQVGAQNQNYSAYDKVNGAGSVWLAPFDITLTASAPYYLNGLGQGAQIGGNARIRAERII